MMQNNLRDGYYLSIYSEIDPIFHINSYSLRHDHNMALFIKNRNEVELVHHWEFERITGKKHHQIAFYDINDAVGFINQLLNEYSLTLDDMREVLGTPQLSTCENYHSIDDFTEVSYHSVSHLFTSMLLDTNIFYNENVISLAIDGGPDVVVDSNAFKKNAYCGAVSKKGKIEIFPIPSPGPYWFRLAKLYGMPEGTLMALAYATKTRFIGKTPTLPDIFNASDSNENMIILREFADSIISYPLNRINEICIDYDNQFTEYENKLSMIAKFVQETSLECVHNLIQKTLDEHQIHSKDTFISLSGGYALNCPTNTSIMHKFGFKGQLMCPCINDSGIAIGMGLYYFFKNCNSFFDYRFDTAFYGCSDNGLSKAIENFAPFVKSIRDGIEQACDDIINEPIVWFDGRSEVGPRALGHRSILANPAKAESKDLLNIYKKREWWRPVAPIVLESELDNWFWDSFSSPYMLNNFIIKSKKKEFVKAILHLDDSARVQSITESENGRLFSIVSEIYQKTSIPIICNTSLNDKGEPIVNRISEALNFALRKGIRLVYANGSRIELFNHDKYFECDPLERNCVYFSVNIGNNDLLKKLNPYDLSITELIIRRFNEELHEYDITSEGDAQTLKRVIKKIRTVTDIYGDFFELLIL